MKLFLFQNQFQVSVLFFPGLLCYQHDSVSTRLPEVTWPAQQQVAFMITPGWLIIQTWPDVILFSFSLFFSSPQFPRSPYSVELPWKQVSCLVPCHDSILVIINKYNKINISFEKQIYFSVESWSWIVGTGKCYWKYWFLPWVLFHGVCR